MAIIFVFCLTALHNHFAYFTGALKSFYFSQTYCISRVTSDLESSQGMSIIGKEL